MKLPSVYAIIVNWNGKNDTLECLASLHRIKLHAESLSVVVVDNGSTDGSCQAVSKLFPGVHVIPIEKNIGFSGGTNKGIEFAQKHNAQCVWILNNDTVVDPDVLSGISSFQTPGVGAVGSKIYFYKGREFHKDKYKKQDLGHVIWYAGGIIDWKNMLAHHRGVDEVDHGQFDHIEETDFITGCSCIIRTEIFKKIGLLDESYFMYMEDLDLSLRIKRAGWKTIYNPSSVLYHKNASSSGGPGSTLHEYYQTRNRLRIGMKYAPLRTKIALLKEGLLILNNNDGIRKQAVSDWLKGIFGQYHEK